MTSAGNRGGSSRRTSFSQERRKMRNPPTLGAVGTFDKVRFDEKFLDAWLRRGTMRHVFIGPDVLGSRDNAMAQAWKIAPGRGAEDWKLFLKQGCIGLGWLELPDYRKYSNEDAVLAALEQEYGKGVKGCGAGAAKTIWRFLDEVKPQHIVVANKGYNRVVGIGIVTSNYLAPTSKQNPLRDDTTTHRHHVRLVDWLIKEPIDLPGHRFFVQPTLWPVENEELKQIRHAYAASFPQLTTILDQLLDGYQAGISGWLPEEVAESPTLFEGAVRKVTVNAYERNPVARQECVAAHGTTCCVCGFSFGAVYGPQAEGYIHVHHIRPLSEVGGEYIVDPVEDLRPVCPNCHAVLHLGGQSRSIEEVKQLLDQPRNC
jgi:hypothetical protein